MNYKDILRLSEGAHAVTVNTERCLVVRMRDGFTVTTRLPDRKLLIQRCSERGQLLREDRVDDVFSPNDEEDARRRIYSGHLSMGRSRCARMR